MIAYCRENVLRDAATESGFQLRRFRKEVGPSSEAAMRFVIRREGKPVCWHGHRDFMREVFKREPSARIRTSLAHYKSGEDFEARYRGTKRGSLSPPMVCRCGDPE